MLTFFADDGSYGYNIGLMLVVLLFLFVDFQSTCTL